MANINQITIDGTTYDIEDTTARSSTGVTDGIKVALLNCFQNVAWTTSSGQTYYDALYDALYAGATVESITATYTQSGTVYDTASLSDLTSDLVVTATWSDSTTSTVSSNNYTLSGDLDIGASATGTSTITVSYNGATTTFTVTVTTSAIYHWDFTSSLTDSIGGVTATLTNCSMTSGTGIVIPSNTGYSDTSYADLGAVFGYNRTIEMDITDVTDSFDSTVFGIMLEFWDGSSTSSWTSFGYHYSTTSSKNRFGVVSSTWSYSSVATSRTYFNDQDTTLKITVDSEGVINVYANGTDLGITKTAAHEVNNVFLCSGLNYPAWYDMTITGVRIYEGVV